ncbi:hypothetical protein GCM10009647_006310 [Streptomyces sanglieri]
MTPSFAVMATFVCREVPPDRCSPGEMDQAMGRHPGPAPGDSSSTPTTAWTKGAGSRESGAGRNVQTKLSR